VDASHEHFGFWGAYSCGIIAVIYLALGKSRQGAGLDGWAWKWSFALLNVGLLGMVGGLLVAGMDQAFFERALGGSTWSAFTALQHRPWYIEGMWSRFGFGLIFTAGYAILMYDMLTIGKSKQAQATIEPREAAA
jgi:nitric oxide reductase subunit B